MEYAAFLQIKFVFCIAGSPYFQMTYTILFNADFFLAYNLNSAEIDLRESLDSIPDPSDFNPLLSSSYFCFAKQSTSS